MKSTGLTREGTSEEGFEQRACEDRNTCFLLSIIVSHAAARVKRGRNRIGTKD